MMNRKEANFIEEKDDQEPVLIAEEEELMNQRTRTSTINIHKKKVKTSPVLNL